jgi:hypothetical protein
MVYYLQTLDPKRQTWRKLGTQSYGSKAFAMIARPPKIVFAFKAQNRLGNLPACFVLSD